MSRLINVVLGIVIAFSSLALPPFSARADEVPPATGITALPQLQRNSELASPNSPAAPQAVVWNDGGVQYSTIVNCISIIQGFPYSEAGIGTYVSQAIDPVVGQPVPNQAYYVRVVVAGLGNSCSGQRAWIDIQLPPNTTLATNSAPILCYYYGNGVTDQLTGANCPQNLPASPFNPGALSIPANDPANANTWPIPQGKFLEIRIPLRSSAALTGDAFRAHVQALDGWDFPWLRPQVGTYVFSNTPSFAFNVPSTISITAISAYSFGYIYTFGIGGAVYLDFGTTASYGQQLFAGNVTPGAYTVFTDWSNFSPLQPDVTYHWRIRFVPTSGSAVNSAGQTFRTLPNGRVTIGDGIPATCIETALLNQLAAGATRDIRFDCGALPITITLSAPISISGNKTIDGGNKVNLTAAPNFRHFAVASNAKLVLRNMTLQKGFAATCGGSVYVQSNGWVELHGSRMISNTSADHGGALCLETGAYGLITGTLLTGNSAALGGGAMWQEQNSTVEMYYSELSSNNGGRISGTGGGAGLATGALLVASYSLFASNQAYSGGGLYLDSGGNAALYASTVSSNLADVDAGGIFGSPFLANVTVVGNQVLGNACQFCSSSGGVYGNATLRNTIISGNAPRNCPTGALTPVVFSDGYNIDSANTCKLTGTGDKVNTDPRIGNLTANGGRTRTHAVLSGSPAINAGNNAWCVAYGCLDQRGVYRVGGTIDIGAYEYQPRVFLPIVSR